MKRLLSIIILLSCFSPQHIFSFGSVEREMNDNDKKRVEHFMSNFFTKLLSLSAEEYENIFYKKLVSISFDDGTHNNGIMFKKFLDYTTLPENEKTNEIGRVLHQSVLFVNGSDAKKFIKQFENTGIFTEKNKAKPKWFSGFDVGVAAFNIPAQNCCSFEQELILSNGKDSFNVKTDVLLYIDEKNIFLAYVSFDID